MGDMEQLQWVSWDEFDLHGQGREETRMGVR